MADVFVSYARVNAHVAHAFAERVRAIGVSVFIDAAIETGSSWSKKLQDELDAARVVVTLWSEAAAASEWVNNEARYAKNRNVLFPATIETCVLPFEFSGTQSADLIDWDGDPGDPRILALLTEISQRVRGTAGVRAAVRPVAGAAARAANAQPRRSDPDTLPAEKWMRAYEAGERAHGHFMRMWCVFHAGAFAALCFILTRDVRAFEFLRVNSEITWAWAAGLGVNIIGVVLLLGVFWVISSVLSAVITAALWLLLVLAPLLARFGGGLHMMNRQIARAARRAGERVEDVIALNASYAASQGYTIAATPDGKLVTDIARANPTPRDPTPNPVYRKEAWAYMFGIAFAASVVSGFWMPI